MKIPKQFELAGTTWKVEQAAPLMGAMGATFMQEAKIQVLADLAKDIKEQTFLHELVHSILFTMGKQAAEHDEVFVDGFAHLLHQYLKTAK